MLSCGNPGSLWPKSCLKYLSSNARAIRVHHFSLFNDFRLPLSYSFSTMPISNTNLSQFIPYSLLYKHGIYNYLVARRHMRLYATIKQIAPHHSPDMHLPLATRISD